MKKDSVRRKNQPNPNKVKFKKDKDMGKIDDDGSDRAAPNSTATCLDRPAFPCSYGDHFYE